MIEGLLSFVQANKPYFDVAQALSSVVNLFAWCLAVFLLILALRKSRIESLSLGPFSTTLADLLTRQSRAEPSSAVRAWPERSNDEIDDSVAHGGQAWLRWWSVDSFFPASPL